jgi:hypothetical protein
MPSDVRRPEGVYLAEITKSVQRNGSSGLS